MNDMHEQGPEDGLRIGFIGLGNMGGPMCRRLVEARLEVAAFDRSPSALATAAELGARPTPSVRDCAASCDVLLTSLPRPDHVLEVVRDAGALAALPAGSVWVDLTTNRRELIEELAGERGDISVVDSPVTGAVDGARAGTLTLFVGGDPDVRTRVAPILCHLGRVIECGPLGTGTVVKLVTNQLWFIHAAAFGEALALGLANGVALETLDVAIRESVADSFVARHDAPSIFAGHYDPSFTLDLCLKDLGLIDELSDSVAAELVLTRAALEVFTDAGARYGRHVGEMHVAKRIEDDAGMSFRMAGT